MVQGFRGEDALRVIRNTNPPRHVATVGSYGGGISDEPGTPVGSMVQRFRGENALRHWVERPGAGVLYFFSRFRFSSGRKSTISARSVMHP